MRCYRREKLVLSGPKMLMGSIGEKHHKLWVLDQPAEECETSITEKQTSHQPSLQCTPGNRCISVRSRWTGHWKISTPIFCVSLFSICLQVECRPDDKVNIDEFVSSRREEYSWVSDSMEFALFVSIRIHRQMIESCFSFAMTSRTTDVYWSVRRESLQNQREVFVAWVNIFLGLLQSQVVMISCCSWLKEEKTIMTIGLHKRNIDRVSS